LEHKSIGHFESTLKKPINEISLDEQFSILFFKDSNGIGVLNFKNMELKSTFNHKDHLSKGYFSSDFSVFHVDHFLKNSKRNQFTIFNSKTKEIFIYQYTESMIEFISQFSLNDSVSFLFSIASLAVVFDSDYKIFNIGNSPGEISCNHEIKPTKENPLILFISGRNQSNPSFIVYYFNQNEANPIYLEDDDKKIPYYIKNETIKQKGIKLSDLTFSGKVHSASVCFPFIAGVSKTMDSSWNLEIKNVYNPRSNEKFIDSLKSTKDCIPIQIFGENVGITSSDDYFYFFCDKEVFKVSLPSTDEMKRLLELDGLIKPARTLEMIKNNDLISEFVQTTEPLRFKTILKSNQQEDETEEEINDTPVDSEQISTVLENIRKSHEQRNSINNQEQNQDTPGMRKTRSRNVMIIKNPERFTTTYRSGPKPEWDEDEQETQEESENLSFLLKPTITGSLTPRESLPTTEEPSNESQTYRIARMKASFSALESGEISVKKGELVIILQDEEDGWSLIFYMNKQGLIPTHYYQELNFKAFQKRKEIVKEFIETEETYVTNLIHLNHYFCVPLQKILPKKVHHCLFSNLATVLNLNGMFLIKLQNISKKDYISQDDELSSILLEFSQTFKLYTEYIVGFENINTVLMKESSKNSKLEKFLKEKKTGLKSKGVLCDLGSYLILPVQRLPRYKLLLSDLMNVKKKLF
jgi:hypothetical protein